MFLTALKKSIPYRQRPFPFPLSYSHHQTPLFSSAAIAMPTIEHVVLFKVNPSTPQSKIDTMLSSLLNLTSLNLTTFLSASPILRSRSAAADSLAFTHILHSRYTSKSDFSTYTTHPDHVAVVKNFILPIIDDILAVDWVSETDMSPPPTGSAVRVTFAKAKVGVSATEAVNAIGEMKTSATEQVSFGENFSLGRAKGYGVGMVCVFKSVEELDGLMEGKEVVGKEKVEGLVDDVIVLDYVVSNANGASASFL